MFAYLITPDKQVELCCHMYIEVSGRSVGGQEEPPPTIPRLGLSLQLPKRYGSTLLTDGTSPSHTSHKPFLSTQVSERAVVRPRPV